MLDAAKFAVALLCSALSWWCICVDNIFRGNHIKRRSNTREEKKTTTRIPNESVTLSMKRASEPNIVISIVRLVWVCLNWENILN